METRALTPQEFVKIREFLKERCGVELGEDKEYLVKTRLFDWLRESGESFSSLLEQVSTNPEKFLDKFIHLLTTHETSWFRDLSFWNTLEHHILPQLFRRICRGETVKIWSSGCSTGQEPYSLVLLIEEFCNHHGFSKGVSQFHLRATDISQEVLEGAQRACYTSFEIQRGLSENRRNEYFQPQGDLWQLNQRFSRRVEFSSLNLIENFPQHFGTFHLILCRNVLVYFASKYKQKVLEKFHQVLHPEGFLFLGASEFLEKHIEGLKKKNLRMGNIIKK
jgi:chemotaxis protein methyltransferase CheR